MMNHDELYDKILENARQQGIKDGWFDPDKHILRIEKDGDTVRIIMDKKKESENETVETD